MRCGLSCADLSSRVDSVKEESLKLRSENQVLGQYIENLMSASSVFQATTHGPNDAAAAANATPHPHQPTSPKSAFYPPTHSFPPHRTPPFRRMEDHRLGSVTIIGFVLHWH